MIMEKVYIVVLEFNADDWRFRARVECEFKAKSFNSAFSAVCYMIKHKYIGYHVVSLREKGELL